MIGARELVRRGTIWLRAAECQVVLSEARAPGNREIPDIIGWMKDGTSILIEVKIQRKDYRDDWRPDRKHFRREPASGMGSMRYYLSPRGVITSADASRHGWGLLLPCPGGLVAELASPKFERNAEAELRLIARLAANNELPQMSLWE